jgi:NADH-quinone oxidoreductase subunit J
MLLEQLLFWPFALMSIVTSVMVLASYRPVYATLYLVLSLMSVAFVIWSLGAAPLAIFEVIVYAGAIMVFFLFVVMMLNLGTGHASEDLRPASRKQLILPGIFSAVILVGLFLVISGGSASGSIPKTISLQDLGRTLFTTNFLGVKLASLVLLIATIGGMHLGFAADKSSETSLNSKSEGANNGR